MPTLIAGIGTAVPPHRIAQADAAEIAQQFSCETAAQERLFQSLYRRAGVETRHSVVLHRSAGELDRSAIVLRAQEPDDSRPDAEVRRGSRSIGRRRGAEGRSRTRRSRRLGSLIWSRSRAVAFMRRALISL